MKKSFSTLLLTAVLLAFAALSAAGAAEPVKELSDARFREARKQYIEDGVMGFRVGIRLGEDKEPSPAQIEAARKAIADWLDEDMIPFLQKNGILGEWVKMQFDPVLREFHRKIADVKTMDELIKMARESEIFLEKNYPGFIAKMQTPEGIEVLKKHQSRLMQTLEE